MSRLIGRKLLIGARCPEEIQRDYRSTFIVKSDRLLGELVTRAAELRRACEGRLPDRITWRWQSFLWGTRAMTAQELGAYMLLLMEQLDKGSLPTDQAQLANIARVPAEQFGELWHRSIRAKFAEHEDALYNKTALQEFIAATAALVKQRVGGSKGGAKRKDSDSGFF